MRKRSRPGFSAHGLKFTAVVRAFQRAEAELGITWLLKGRGHCRRCTLDGRYSRHVSRVAKSWDWYRRPPGPMAVMLYPYEIVQRAARILRVRSSVLMGSEFR